MKDKREMDNELTDLIKGLETFREKWLDLPLESDRPIIKKSGGTWVARDKGINYLLIKIDALINKTYEKKKDEVKSITEIENDLYWGIWKPISEIEITDEIAKLRPMVMCSCSGPAILHAYMSNEEYQSIVWHKGEANRFMDARLATVSDLEDS